MRIFVWSTRQESRVRLKPFLEAPSIYERVAVPFLTGLPRDMWLSFDPLREMGLLWVVCDNRKWFTWRRISIAECRIYIWQSVSLNVCLSALRACLTIVWISATDDGRPRGYFTGNNIRYIVSERGRDEEVNGMVHRSLCAASSNEACLIKLA